MMIVMITIKQQKRSPTFTFAMKHPDEFAAIGQHVLSTAPTQFRRNYVTDFLRRAFEQVEPPTVAFTEVRAAEQLKAREYQHIR